MKDPTIQKCATIVRGVINTRKAAIVSDRAGYSTQRVSDTLMAILREILKGFLTADRETPKLDLPLAPKGEIDLIADAVALGGSIPKLMTIAYLEDDAPVQHATRVLGTAIGEFWTLAERDYRGAAVAIAAALVTLKERAE